jgi:hypothetical protein
MKNLILSVLLIIPSLTKSQDPLDNKKPEIKTDFSKIKDVLKNDQLEEEVNKKLAKEKGLKELEEKELKERFLVPQSNEIWSFLSELWIIRNTEKLKWNFEKPDYGMDEFFAKFLEDQGYYELNFKILLLDNSLIPHFCLPSNPNEAIFLFSAPFMRILDLSKLEISLLLLEDYNRNKMNQFKNRVKSPDLEKTFGMNFQKQEFPQKVFDDVLKSYDDLVFDKGFNFEEQFEITMKMESILKSNTTLWNTYLNLIEKIGNLSKTNLLYKDYAKLYPSPEMQLNWLKPKKKAL